jgi:hypothetical protein
MLCGAIMISVPGPVQQVPQVRQPAAVAIVTPAADHSEPPHPPEAEGTPPPAAQDTEFPGGGLLTLDHPVFGQMDARNVLG